MGALTFTLPQRLQVRAQETPDSVAYLHLTKDCQWQSCTWSEVANRVEIMAGHLARLGLQSGDRVAIMMPASPEWEYSEYAAMTLGCIVVGLDSHDAARNLQHILQLTQPRLVIAHSNEQLSLIQENWRAPELAILGEKGATAGDVHSLHDLLANTSSNNECPQYPGPSPEHTATIIFTSGSTGQPKGIAYSHRQVVRACDSILARFPSLGSDARLVCWLPLSNLFQRMINVLGMTCGARTYFVDKPEKIAQLLPAIEPTFFIGVPRFFEKLHAAIVNEIDRQPAPVRALINVAWAIGTRTANARRERNRPGLFWLALQPLTKPIRNRIRSVMGRHLQFMVSGSAPLPRWLMERFHGLGWLVLEAYGISENVIPIALNTPDHYRFGSVGQPLPENELRVADDKELLVRGPGVFTGYYGTGGTVDPAPINADGFFHTGDYATIDADGYVWLEGRKSEVFKTSTGRRIAPAPIEAALKQIDYVEHAVIVGRDRPFVVAIVAINPEHPFASEPSSAETSTVIANDVATACDAFPDYQRPGAIIVSLRPFSIATGELTANLKIRRKPVEERFRSQIEQAYGSAQASRGQPGLSRPSVIIAP